MELRENLSRSWEFMKGLTEDIGNLIILIIIGVIPIINIILVGYAAKITRLGEAIDKPPKIGEYVSNFIEGVKVLIIIIIYSIFPLIIFSVFLGLAIISEYGVHPLIYPGELITVLSKGLAALGILIASIIGFIIFIFGAMGIIHMIKTDSFGAAFNISEILDLIRSVGWSRYLGWLIIIYVLSIIVTSISSLHWIISAILNVFFIVFLARSAHYIYPMKEEVSQLQFNL